MDIHHINQDKAKAKMILAMLLSVAVVAATALLGRGFLHIKSALTQEFPDAVTLIQIELQRDPEADITSVETIPYREGTDEYGFLYEKNDEKYFARVVKKEGGWDFKEEPELLHAESDVAAAPAENE
jgi:hypothetical protein